MNTNSKRLKVPSVLKQDAFAKGRPLIRMSVLCVGYHQFKENMESGARIVKQQRGIMIN